MQSIGVMHHPRLQIEGLPELGSWYGRQRRFARLSTPQGVVLEIGEGGFFGLSGLPSRQDYGVQARRHLAQALELTNAFLASFYSSLLREQNAAIGMMAATFSDVFSLRSLDSGPTAFGGPRGAIDVMFYLRGDVSLPGDTHHLSIHQGVVESTLKEMSGLLAHDVDEATTLAALYLEAVVAAHSHSYARSLVLAWACAERCINRLWADVVEAEVSRGPNGSSRKKRLEDGRTFNAAVIIEWLWSAGRISEKGFANLVIARRARNNWMHGLSAVTPEEAEAALLAVDELYPCIGLPTRLRHGGYMLI